MIMLDALASLQSDVGSISRHVWHNFGVCFCAAILAFFVSACIAAVVQSGPLVL